MSPALLTRLATSLRSGPDRSISGGSSYGESPGISKYVLSPSTRTIANRDGVGAAAALAIL